MNRPLALFCCALALPGLALAASRSYDVGPFDAVEVAAGIDADVRLAPSGSVVAEGPSDSLGELRVRVEGSVLHLDRAPGSWFTNLFSWGRPAFRVHVVTPALRSLSASSGAAVRLDEGPQGDFSVAASSGSGIDIRKLRGGAVKAVTSSGSHLRLGGSCIAFDAKASSGSSLDAKALACESVTVHASSGSAISVAARSRVEGHASSGSSVQVRGRPPLVQVERSSGAGVVVRD